LYDDLSWIRSARTTPTSAGATRAPERPTSTARATSGSPGCECMA